MIPLRDIRTPEVRTLVEVLGSAHVQVRYARERGERLDPHPGLLRTELQTDIEQCERSLASLRTRRYPPRDIEAAERALRTRVDHCRLWLAKLEAGR